MFLGVKFFQKIDDFSKPLALLSCQKLSPRKSRYFFKKTIFIPKRLKFFILSYPKEENQDVSKGKIFPKKSMIFPSL